MNGQTGVTAGEDPAILLQEMKRIQSSAAGRQVPSVAPQRMSDGRVVSFGSSNDVARPAVQVQTEQAQPVAVPAPEQEQPEVVITVPVQEALIVSSPQPVVDSADLSVAERGIGRSLDAIASIAKANPVSGINALADISRANATSLVVSLKGLQNLLAIAGSPGSQEVAILVAEVQKIWKITKMIADASTKEG